jgi:polyhydroxyalkanoate synthesis regulator phasin
MRRLIWLPVAGFLLIAGAAVAMAAPTVLDRAQAALQGATPTDPAATAAPTDPGATSAPNQGPHGPWAGLGLKGAADDVLNTVLADLVANGTITQAQADAITNAVKDEIANRQDAAAKLRQQWQDTASKLKTFLQDGVITQDEIDTLPADSPLRIAFDSIAKDGQVTLDQLKNFLPFGGEYAHGGPGGFGHGLWGFPGTPDQPNEEQPSESPAPTATP